ncbi:monooxygenase, partial [Escherichia coli]|nr:monooxygenase [Escherichia coli]
IQQVVGQISAWAYAVEATVLKATSSLQQAYEAHRSGDEALLQALNVTAELDAARAQVIAGEWVQRAAGELFNALGASD